MPRRRILTERQRSALFDLPADEPVILHHYTLADDDIEHIRTRRHSRNRLGFALQLCAFRYPGRLLTTGETIPLEISKFIAAQLGENPDHLSHYAETAVTRRRHLIELRSIYGYKMFSGRGARDLKSWLISEAETAHSNEDLVQRFVERCRATQTILPGVTVIERLCADALVAAERRIEARIVEHLDIELRNKLDALLTEGTVGSVSRFVWLRQFEVGQNSADMNRLLDKLEFLQRLEVDVAILGEVPPHRVTRLRRQGERYFAGDLRDCIFRDIRPPIPTTSAHLYRGIRPALTRCREALVFDISFLAFRHVVEGLSFGRIVRRVRAGRRCAPAGRGWHLRRWVHQ